MIFRFVLWDYKFEKSIIKVNLAEDDEILKEVWGVVRM